MSTISVIIPVYNVEKYLRRCIESILHQTYEDFELILVDDGSPDRCGEVCDDYSQKDQRVFVIHKKNGGLSDARNAGLDWIFNYSDSQWITFVDSDDWVHQKYLEVMYSVATEYHTSICSCGYKRVSGYADDENVDSYSVIVGNPDELCKAIFDFTIYNYSVACMRLYKKELWSDIRYPVGRYHEDEHTTYKLLYKENTLAIANVKLYYYYINNDGIMKSKLSPQKAYDKLDGVLNQCDFFFQNHQYNSLDFSFGIFCRYINNLMTSDTDAGKFKDIVTHYLEEIKLRNEKYRKHKPWLLKLYGYPGCVSNRAFALEQFKNDRNDVRVQKGWLYSFLWGVKNYYKYKKNMREKHLLKKQSIE